MDISDRSGNRPSPGSSIGSSQSPGALSDASAGIAHVVRGLLRSEKNGLSRSRGGFLGASLPPSGTAVSYLGAVWCVGGVVAVPVRMMWLLVFAKVCCGCLPSGECNFSCTQNWVQLKLFGCPVFDGAPVLSGRRAVCQCRDLRPRRATLGINSGASMPSSVLLFVSERNLLSSISETFPN